MSYDTQKIIKYCKENYNSFSPVEFFKYFKFTEEKIAEKAFKACIGSIKRIDDKPYSEWAKNISNSNFEVCWLSLST